MSKEYLPSGADRHMAKAGGYPDPGVPAVGATSTPAGAIRLSDLRRGHDSEVHTTSFSVVDKAGNAVGVTPTLGGCSGATSSSATPGSCLNNRMRLGLHVTLS
ncbi:MAG: gamma-glutamyltransferase [Gemmatimonadetes bacterium]|nr:gamma-glutamyltransferase [Gemmatimonadota bacterium]